MNAASKGNQKAFSYFSYDMKVGDSLRIKGENPKY